jgi:type II secretory pathway pseudopilin PulG
MTILTILAVAAILGIVVLAFAEHLAGVPQRKGKRQEAVERQNQYGWTESRRKGLK